MFSTICRWLFVLSLVPISIAHGQRPHTMVQVPQHAGSQGFYEHFGTQWGLQGRGFFFQNGGPGPVPVFGGYDPSGDARFHFGGRHGFLNIYAGTGSSRSMASGSSLLTFPQAGYGFISSGAWRPFVVGYQPIVGDASYSPLAERISRLQRGERGTLIRRSPTDEESDSRFPRDPRRELAGDQPPDSPGTNSIGANSTASRGDLSIAAIKREQAIEEARRHEEALALRERALGQEQLGNVGVARIYYQQAAKRADGALLEEIQAKLQALRTRSPH